MNLNKVAGLSREEYSDWLMKELWRAYYDARKGKRSTLDEHLVELNAAENLVNLHDAIMEGCYRTGRGIAFIVWRPVTREIFAAPFRDRIVHHFLYNMVANWWDKRLICDAYSCRKRKGVLYGVDRMEHHIRSVSDNYERAAYVVKLDIRGYFMSLPREGLMQRVKWGLDREFPERGQLYQTLMILWQTIIFDDPCDGVIRKGSLEDWDMLDSNKSLFCQPPGQGIVIGNLSSQLLSNLYLDLLDRFVKYDLGYKHYGRYVDDFYMVVTEEELPQAKRDIGAIADYLTSLKLTLHPEKILIQEVHKGVPWLGSVIYPWGRAPSKRVKRFYTEAAMEVAMGIGDMSSIVSYMGHIKHDKHRAFEKRLFDYLGWEYRF